MHAELNERVEAATSTYSVTGDSLEYIYFVLLAKNHRDIQTRCLVYEFSFTDVFNDINHGYRATILKKKFFFGCFHFIWLWLFISIMRRCAERCALQLYQTLRSTGPPTAWSCNYHQLHPVIIDDNWRQAL